MFNICIFQRAVVLKDVVNVVDVEVHHSLNATPTVSVANIAMPQHLPPVVSVPHKPLSVTYIPIPSVPGASYDQLPVTSYPSRTGQVVQPAQLFSGVVSLVSLYIMLNP